MSSVPRMRRATRAVRVGSTPYGLGVFAKRSFADRETIGEIPGTVIDDPEYGSDYCMEFGGSCSLEPGGPFRYLNHSCEPNCKLVHEVHWDEKTSQARRTMFLMSLATIGPGEQLTIDYAWPAVFAIPCECGSPSCRGWIVDSDEFQQLQAAQELSISKDYA